jgi:hypothetical protein
MPRAERFVQHLPAVVLELEPSCAFGDRDGLWWSARVPVGTETMLIANP